MFDRRERRWELVIPRLAIAFLGYMFYRNATGQVYPFNWFPWVVTVWALIGAAIVLLIPGLARGSGRRCRSWARRARAETDAADV